MIEKLVNKNTSQEKERQKAKKHNKESLTQLSSSSKNQKKTLQEELWRQKHHYHPTIGAAQLVPEPQRNSVPEPHKNSYLTTAYYKRIKTKVKTKRRDSTIGK